MDSVVPGDEEDEAKAKADSSEAIAGGAGSNRGRSVGDLCFWKGSAEIAFAEKTTKNYK